MKVSILIPVYNASKFLSRTIESALNQLWSNKEIVIVDDGSSDDSFRIAQSYAQRYSEVRVFKQNNGGACRARNLAFEKSTGDYIQYLDADDILSQDKISSQMKLVPRIGNGVVVSSAWVHFFEGRDINSIEVPKRFLDQDWNDPMDWLCSSWEGLGMGLNSIWLIPRHLVTAAGPWDERLSINQDGEFMCRILLHAEGVKFSSEGVVYYRSGNSQSVSQTKNKKNASALLLSYELYQHHALKHRDTIRIRRALARNYLSFIYSFNDSFPILTSQARQSIVALKVDDVSHPGGRNFRILAGLIGFENGLKVRSFIRKVSLILFRRARNSL